MDRICVLVFEGATALAIDGEPLICDGCTDEFVFEEWAIEKFAAGRNVVNVVFVNTDPEIAAYCARYGYQLVRD